MPCYKPIDGYRSKTVNATGKRSIVFNISEGYSDLRVTIPCGRCIGCKLERSRVWAVRCYHESTRHKENCFITLTYDEQNLPQDQSLKIADFQRFMKRLRKLAHPKTIRFFHCGEYGEKGGRPHYHACIFGFDFEDKTLWKERNDQKYYVSEKLKELWPQGHSTIGEVTFESAAYVARYITKKQTGKGSEIYYERIDPDTGEISEIQREYVTMSRRPGIGKAWFESFKTDAFPHDFVVVRGKRMKPPRYYLDQLEKENATKVRSIKLKRQSIGKKLTDDNTHDRRLVKEYLQYERLKKLKREYEETP
ncbi:MAG: replication initiator protein [Arizlama microvirus]|nr:MAG: replication initiator protein [Arizlama microvirus]